MIRNLGTLVTELPNGGFQASGNPSDIKRAEMALSPFKGPPVQCKTTTKFLSTSCPLPVLSGELDDNTVQTIMLLFSKEKGAKLFTTPSIALRENENDEIAIIRETKGGSDWYGIKLNTQNERVGLKIAGNLKVEMRLSPQEELHQTQYSHDPKDYYSWNITRDTEPIQANGSTQIQFLGTKDGRYLYQFVTVQMQDPSGQPAQWAKRDYLEKKSQDYISTLFAKKWRPE